MVSIDAVQALVLNEFSVDHDSNELREAREMACILEAYIGVAKKRFIDNMEQVSQVLFGNSFSDGVVPVIEYVP